MKLPAPVPDQPRLFRGVEDQLKKIFFDVLFLPIIEKLRVAQPAAAEKLAGALRTNAGLDPLLEALRSGRVRYLNGEFVGKFNAAISKGLLSIGARFSKGRGVFALDAADVPPDVLVEAATANQRALGIHQAIVSALDETEARLDVVLAKSPVDATGAIVGVVKDFRKVAVEIGVHPEIGDAARDRFAADYSDSLKLPIKNFTNKEIHELRQMVERNADAGARFDRLQAVIRARFDVSARKARFLAQQETSLFMAKYQQQRVGEAGVRRYRWSDSGDVRVRHDHRELNGRIFFYDSPPIVDRATGRRANPGEDFQCRCVAEPILDAEIGERAA